MYSIVQPSDLFYQEFDRLNQASLKASRTDLECVQQCVGGRLVELHKLGNGALEIAHQRSYHGKAPTECETGNKDAGLQQSVGSRRVELRMLGKGVLEKMHTEPSLAARPLDARPLSTGPEAGPEAGKLKHRPSPPALKTLRKKARKRTVNQTRFTEMSAPTLVQKESEGHCSPSDGSAKTISAMMTPVELGNTCEQLGFCVWANMVHSNTEDLCSVLAQAMPEYYED